VFVGSGIFKSEDPATMARAIVEATTHFQDPDVLTKVSRGLGEPMHGLEIETLETRLQDRGWESRSSSMKAGVRALQGDFREHARAFAEAGATPVEVRLPADLDGVDCLAIPG